MTSSNVGILWRSRMIALLGSRMSMHSRMEPSFFGGMTIGDTQGIGLPTGSFSIVSFLRSHSSSSSIFGLMWKGIFLFVIATGHIDSSMCSLTCTPFSFPMPFVSPRYLSSHLSSSCQVDVVCASLVRPVAHVCIHIFFSYKLSRYDLFCDRSCRSPHLQDIFCQRDS